jgi:hypothetical protein
MRISLPHKYRVRLFTGATAMAFLLGYGFSMTASAAFVPPQAGEEAGTDTETPTPETPKPPKPPKP